MLNLADIFTSRTRTKILQTLFGLTTPVPLRHLAELTATPVFSVQRAVEQLVHETLIIRSRRKRYTLYSINQKNQACEFLKQVFTLQTQSLLKFKAKQNNAHAKAVLAFCSDGIKLFSNLKTK